MSPPLSQTKRAIADLLQRVPYFAEFTELEIFTLVHQGYRQILPPKHFICHEGDQGNSFYILLSGLAEVISTRRSQYIDTLNEGDFFGEISLLTGVPRTATVRTIADTKLFVLNRQHLRHLFLEHPNLAEQIAQKLLERQQNLINKGVLYSFDFPRTEEVTISYFRERLSTLFGV